MAKVVRIVGTVVGVAIAAVGVVTGNPALVALGTKIVTYSNIAAALIDVVAPRKPSFSGSGNPLQFQTNPQSGIPYCIGRTRMSGVRGHGETYDATSYKSESRQDVLSFMVLLSGGGAIEQIETFKADKEVVTFNPSTGMAIGTHANFMAQVVSLGLAGASALALTFGGGSFPGWSSAHKLSGITHALWDLRYDDKGEHFGAGVPEPQWIGKWVKAYDPRKDSTYPGGSGSHRALDESTYEWTANPYLHGLTWALGRWQNGKRTLGIGSPISNIRVGDFVEGANIADANGWTCGGVEYSTDTKMAVLARMLQAGGGEVTQTGAMIGCRVNAPRVSVATVEANDLLDGLSVATTKRRRERFNTVIPRYRSEDHDWEVISGSPVSVPDYVTQDGGVRTKEIDFPLVQHEGTSDGNVQAGQLAAYEIVNSREAGPWRFTTGPKFIGVKTGACITLNHPDEGLDMQDVIVRSVRRDPVTLKLTFEVETETASKHDFALGKSTTPPPTWSPTPPDLTPPTPSEALWSLEAIDQGSLPALKLLGACEFPGADTVLIEYKKVLDADWISMAPQSASEPVNLVIPALDPETFYEVRLAYRSDNRTGDWLVLPTVQTGDSPITNFNDRNDRDGSAVAAPTITSDGQAIDHTLNDDGSADISFEWSWAGVDSSIDGFEIMQRSSTSSSAYTPGTTPAQEQITFLPANKRAYYTFGVVPNLYYTFAVRAYRRVDPDINAARVIQSAWVRSTALGENPYRPAANVAFEGDLSGTIDGVDTTDIITAVTNFDARNDQNGTTPVGPTVSGTGSAVDHTVNGNGSVDLSFEWSWGGNEADIDGFEVLAIGRTSSSAYTPGSAPADELVQVVPAYRRSIFLFNVNPILYYTFAVRAYRYVDPNIELGGIIRSAGGTNGWIKPSLTAENPYRPATSIAFDGDITGTIDGVDAEVVAAAATNFDGRNDRLGTTPTAPTIPGSGTAVDHTINTDGSTDISLEWAYSGSEADIDGFEVMRVSRTSSAAYTAGTTPAIENVVAYPAFKRACVFSGVPSNLYYTFAVRTYRTVDPDVNAAGVIRSAWVQPSAVNSENPYLPSANVAFQGDVSGTISSLARQVAPGNLTVYRNWKGVIFGGQIPVSMKFQHLKGGLDVSSAATWAIEKSFGITVSVGNGGTGGVVTITSVNHLAWFVVASTHEGVTHRHLIETPILFAPPPVGSAPYILMPEIDGFTVSSTSVPGSLVGQFQISTGPSGILEANNIFWGYGVDGDGGIQWQLRYRVAGVGSYADGPAATQQLYFDAEYPRGTLAGVGATSATLTGLTANTLYDIQIYARRSTSVPSVGATEVRAVPAAITWLGK